MCCESRARKFALTSTVSLALDWMTKALPHESAVGNYTHMPTPLLVGIGVCLAILAVSHSELVAAGTGLMLGGLAGNAGQVLLQGYATDWIPIGGWLTNLADVSGAVGLACCYVAYLRPLFGSRQRIRSGA